MAADSTRWTLSDHIARRSRWTLADHIARRQGLPPGAALTIGEAVAIATDPELAPPAFDLAVMHTDESLR